MQNELEVRQWQGITCTHYFISGKFFADPHTKDTTATTTASVPPKPGIYKPRGFEVTSKFLEVYYEKESKISAKSHHTAMTTTAMLVQSENLISLVLGLVVFAVCWWMFRKGWFCPGQKLPPLVFSLPVLGSPYLWTSDPRKTLRNLWKKYGPVYRIHIGSKMVVVLSGNEAIRDAIQEHPWTLGSAKPKPTFTTSRVVQGAHTDEGTKWSRRRAVLASSYRALGRDVPDVFRDMFTEEYSQMVRGIRKVYQRSAKVQTFHQISEFTNKQKF